MSTAWIVGAAAESFRRRPRAAVDGISAPKMGRVRVFGRNYQVISETSLKFKIIIRGIHQLETNAVFSCPYKMCTLMLLYKPAIALFLSK